MSYSDITYNSKNPLARFAHRQRFKNSIKAINLTNGISILDYGCGDGKFLNELGSLNKDKNLNLVGYEPFMEPIEGNKIRIEKNLADLNNEKFDVVTCFEVLEHFNPTNQYNYLQNMIAHLKSNGLVIVSVPIEIGIPALVKNLRRRTLFKGEQFSYKNIFKSFLGNPPAEFRIKDGYLDHMGFNYKDLEKLFKKDFVIVTKTFSPFKFLGSNFNSQVFYELKLKQS